MGEERRKAPRARISDIGVTYESATGNQVEASARDIGTGGMFIRVPTPLATGKRIALDIQIQGEPAPWSALGRVVWTRETAEGAERPPGMGVKLIDVEDSVLTGIEALVARSPALKAAPLRERTIIGVGSPPAGPLPVAANEETTIEAEAASGAATRRGRGRWLVVAILLLIAAGAVYALLVGDFDRAVTLTPAPTPVATPAPTPTTPAAGVSSSGSARAPAGSMPATTEPKKVPVVPARPTSRAVPPPPLAPGGRKPGTEDNPY